MTETMDLHGIVFPYPGIFSFLEPAEDGKQERNAAPGVLRRFQIFFITVQEFPAFLLKRDGCGTLLRQDHRPKPGTVCNDIFSHPYPPFVVFNIIQ